MKAIALVVSARERGNCRDFAEYMLERLRAGGVETELVNFHDHRITPCQGCDYECLRRRDPQKRAGEPCPINDDVRRIWEKTWESEILLLFVPTYGGGPPALWFAFSQRAQAFFRQTPVERLRRSVVGAVVIAAPHNSSGAQWTPSIVADEIKWLDREVAGFEVINNAGYAKGDSFGGLIREPEIQRRLAFLAERVLRAAEELAEP